MKVITTIIINLVAIFSIAQNFDTFQVYGKIVSINSRKPIPNGTIMISNVKGYQSDSLGNFIISGLSKGEHKFTFNALGYDINDTVVKIENKNIQDFLWTINTQCKQYNREKALYDLKTNKAVLFVLNGTTQIIYISDGHFKKKYKINYAVYGDILPDNLDCLIAYNCTIFEYLDKKYNKKWRQSVRKDVIGLF